MKPNPDPSPKKSGSAHLYTTPRRQGKKNIFPLKKTFFHLFAKYPGQHFFVSGLAFEKLNCD
jgi:hypothetical protein